MEPIWSIGAWIKRRRRALDLTQDDLAGRVGCSVELISKIETDTRRPSRQVAERLAHTLDLDDAIVAVFIRAARGIITPERLPHPAPAAPLTIPTANRPDEAVAPSSGALTFLFSDIAGSTRLWEQHPHAMNRALARHNALIGQAVVAQSGTIFKTVGDAVHAVFTNPVAALSAALAAQQALAREDWHALELAAPLLVRMALHSGVAEARDGDYFGPTLNRTARLRDAAHGGQTLLSRATFELLADTLPTGVTLRDLGSHRLKDLARAEQLFQVEIADLPGDFPPPRTLTSALTNLPAPPTALVGREEELATVGALLRRTDVRLVTLTGAGGSGKTRLALAAAAEQIETFADGVWFVDLAAIRDPAQVAPAVARALGLQDLGTQPAEQRLLAALRGKRTLLLLDNLEQVTDAAPLLADWLAGAAGLTILATSRVPLHLRGEHIHSVPPLRLPARQGRQVGVESAADLATVRQYDAVALFLARAEEADDAFAINRDNAPAIAEICWRLDGLPLAIELAAARVRRYPPEALLARLEQDGGLSVLTGGPRDLPARQQTLRATIQWSYGLLNDAEQALLARLGIFAGSFDLDAAAVVAGDAAGGALAAHLDLLDALVEQSLVTLVEADGAPRFVLLETVRAFARERLAERGEADGLAERYAAYYVALAEEAEPHTRRHEQLEWLARLDAEDANLQAVLRWGLGAAQRSAAARTLGLRLAGALWYYWFLRGRHSEAYHWLESDASRDPEVPAAVRARALLRASHMLYTTSSFSARRPGYFEGYELAQEANDLWLLTLGQLMSPDMTIRASSVVTAHQSGDPWLLTEALLASETDTMPIDAWLACHETALATARQSGDRQQIVTCIYLMPEWLATEQRQALLIEGTRLANETRFSYAVIEIEAATRTTLMRCGQLDEALDHARATLSLEHDIGNVYGIPNARLTLTWLLAHHGELSLTETLLDEEQVASETEHGRAAELQIYADECRKQRAHLCFLRGDFAGAMALFQDMLQPLDKQPYEPQQTYTMLDAFGLVQSYACFGALGQIALAASNIDDAVNWLHHALAAPHVRPGAGIRTVRDLDFGDNMAPAFAFLSIALLVQGDLRTAEAVVADAELYLDGTHTPWLSMPVYDATARVCLADNQRAKAFAAIVKGLQLVMHGWSTRRSSSNAPPRSPSHSRIQPKLRAGWRQQRLCANDWGRRPGRSIVQGWNSSAPICVTHWATTPSLPRGMAAWFSIGARRRRKSSRPTRSDTVSRRQGLKPTAERRPFGTGISANLLMHLTLP